MRKRHHRFNSWFAAPRLHRLAAKRGWGRRRSRRSRRNAGSLTIGSVKRSVTAGFNRHAIKKAGVILAGNISTTWSADKLMEHVHILGSNPALHVITVLGMAGVNGVFARRFAPKYASEVLIGGILAGVTRAAKLIFPGAFTTCGLGEDLEGLSDWTMSPRNVAHAINTYGFRGLGWAPGPSTPTILAGWGPMEGMGDHALYGPTRGNPAYGQGGNPMRLDGVSAMDAVGEEIESQM